MPVAGPATSSPLEAPSQIAVDSQGNAYIADPGANEVLELSAATGRLSVFAGTGTSGLPVQAPATESELEAPSGVAVDGVGNVYIADPEASEVLEVSASTGVLSVVAGDGVAGMPSAGVATASELEAPSGVAVDGFGNLFIADPGASEVLEVSAATGGLSIVAGDGVAGVPSAGPATSSELQTPSSLAVDNSGHLYIADPLAREVLEVTLSTGQLSIVAGTGQQGAPRPGPASASLLSTPTGVALDSAGNLFIADRGAEQVLEVRAATRTLSIVAGTGKSGHATSGPAVTSEMVAPTGVAVDSEDDIWVADPGSGEVYEIADPPVVSKVSPAAGPSGGGAQVTISGAHLGHVAGIDFGTVPARSFACNGLNSCTAVAPAGDPGTVDVTITSQFGLSRAVAADHFSFYRALPAAPSITAGGRTGPGQVVIAGTTSPGTRVTLWSQPYGRSSFSAGRATTAGPSGAYRFSTTIQRDTRFYADASGHKSATVSAMVRDVVAEVLTARPGELQAKVLTNPPVSGVDVSFYRVEGGGALSNLGTFRITSKTGSLSHSFSLRGTVTIKAQVSEGDGASGGASPARTVTVPQ